MKSTNRQIETARRLRIGEGRYLQVQMNEGGRYEYVHLLYTYEYLWQEGIVVK